MQRILLGIGLLGLSEYLLGVFLESHRVLPHETVPQDFAGGNFSPYLGAIW